MDSGEFGQFREWDYESSLEWFMLGYEMHSKLHDFVKTLNHFYIQNPPLWELDRSWEGFRWIAADNDSDNVLIFERSGADGDSMVFAVNFSAVDRIGYRVYVRDGGVYRELLNSDAEEFGGGGLLNDGPLKTKKQRGGGVYFTADLPALTAVFFKKSTRSAPAVRFEPHRAEKAHIK